MINKEKIFEVLGIKPNEIFMTNECDEFLYKLDENLQGYYFNINEGECGFAHINNEWRTEPILLANLLTGKTKIVGMTSHDKITIKKLQLMPKIEKKEEKEEIDFETADDDDIWAELNRRIKDEAMNQYKQGNHAAADFLGSYVSPAYR